VRSLILSIIQTFQNTLEWDDWFPYRKLSLRVHVHLMRSGPLLLDLTYLRSWKKRYLRGLSLSSHILLLLRYTKLALKKASLLPFMPVAY
jgi:hypothetical protein